MNCPGHDFVVDEERKLILTPAYMLNMQVGEVATGIEKLINKIIEMNHGK